MIKRKYRPRAGAQLSLLRQQRVAGVNLQPLESRTFYRRAAEEPAVSLVADLLPVATEQPGSSGLQQVAEMLQVAEEVNGSEPTRASTPVSKSRRQGARKRTSEAPSNSDSDGEGGIWRRMPMEPRTKVSRTLDERMAKRKAKHPLRPPCGCKKQKCAEKISTERREVIYEAYWELKDPDTQRAWAFS